MNMRIVIYMNIYITKDNAELLERIRGKRSMSGLINELLDRYRKGQGPDILPPKNIDKPIKTPKDAKKAVEVLKGNKSASLCEHFQTKGNCRYPGCKYA